MSAHVAELSLQPLFHGLERNLLLLVAAVLVFAFIDDVIDDQPSWRRAVVGGVLASLIATLSVFTPIWRGETSMLDLRIVPLILAAPIFGLHAALLASVVTALMRGFAIGFTVPSFVVIAVTLFMGSVMAWRLGWSLDPFRWPTRRFNLRDAAILAVLASLAALIGYWPVCREPDMVGVCRLGYPLVAVTVLCITFIAAALHVSREGQHAIRRSLQAMRARLSMIGDNLPGALYQRTAGPPHQLEFRYVSARAQEVLGVPAHELLQDGPRFLDLVHPEDRERVKGALALDKQRGDVPLDIEYRIVRPDGQVRWLHVRSQIPHSEPCVGEAGLVVEGFAFDVTAQKEAEQATEQAEKRQEWLFAHDLLTGLLNRQALLRLMEERFVTPARGLALLLIDMDKSALVNEFFGTDVGDDRLREVVRRLRQAGPEGTVLARTGGDSFALLCDLAPPPLDPQAVAERVFRVMTEPFLRGGQELPMGLCIGFAATPDDAADAGGLFRAAAIALESAREGPEPIARYAPAIERRRAEQRIYDGELKEAIQGGQLNLVYQPIVLTADRSVVGHEALARWSHPTLGSIPPDIFVARAEATGLWADLDTFVLTRACTEARNWPEATRLSVNLSAAWFEIGDVVALIRRVLEETGFPPGRLEVEITERMLIERYERAIGILDQLHKLDIAVSIDDFGAVYSSLGYLHRLPIDRIKLDRSFILDIEHDARAQAVVEAVLSLCGELAIEVVAEGIETQGQFDWLAGHGCPLVQGYLVGRPGPAPGAAALALARPADGSR